MEDVYKVIDRANKCHKRAGLCENFSYILIMLGILMAIIAPDVLAISLSILAASVVLRIIYYNSNKHANKERKELRHNYVRLKLVSQSYYDILSFFTSPDKVTFLQGPKFDGGITIIIAILQSGEIEMREMINEEVATMFRPMSK